jgi:hypothetical protein
MLENYNVLVYPTNAKPLGGESEHQGIDIQALKKEEEK